MKVFARLKNETSDVEKAVRRLADLSGQEKLGKTYPDEPRMPANQLYFCDVTDDAAHAILMSWKADPDVMRAHIPAQRSLAGTDGAPLTRPKKTAPTGALGAHFVSASCRGEKCSICGGAASHKLGEEIPHDDPSPIRHNLTAYVCCAHFALVVGRAASCLTLEKT